MKATDQPEPSPAAESSLEERHDGIYRRMDFLHLAEAIGLEHLAATVRRFVGADFEWQRDEFVECMVAAWYGNQVIIAHPLERILP